MTGLFPPAARICAFRHWCIFAFAAKPSKSLSERDEPGGAAFLRLGMDLESDVEANRTHRRLVTNAKSDGRAQQSEVDVRREGKHIAGIDEPHSLDATAN